MIWVSKDKNLQLKNLRLKNDLKYNLLLRNANSIAFILSLGKAAFTNNMLAVNYINFIQIIRSGSSINRLSLIEQDKLLLEFNLLKENIKEL